eukprot:scaffold15862_cov146-Isochrysis_galbana.AAC.1
MERAIRIVSDHPTWRAQVGVLGWECVRGWARISEASGGCQGECVTIHTSQVFQFTPHVYPSSHLTCVPIHTSRVSLFTPHVCPYSHLTCVHIHTSRVSLFTPHMCPNSHRRGLPQSHLCGWPHSHQQIQPIPLFTPHPHPAGGLR